MQIVSSLHEMSNPVSLEKKNISECRLLKILPRVADGKVNILFLFFLENRICHFMQIVSIGNCLQCQMLKDHV